MPERFQNNYHRFEYTCIVKCADGVTRSFLSDRLFENINTFRLLISMWDGSPGPNGGDYHYFETPEQQLRNNHSVGYPCGTLDVVMTASGSVVYDNQFPAPGWI